MHTYKIYPQETLHSIQEIEKRLGFIHAPHNFFETLEIQKDIQLRGLAKQKRGDVSLEQEKLGIQYQKEISSAYLSPVSLHFLGDSVGFGLFAEQDISPGDYVGEYTGLIRENNRRYFEPLNNYCYEYPVEDDVGRNFVIDATSGGLTRFINHNFSPNLKPTYVFLDGFYHVIFIAILPVKKNSQLTYNYGKNYWYLRHTPADL